MMPPLPFNPFPDLAVYAVGERTFIYDDRSVDYDALRVQQQEQMMAMNGPDGPGMGSPESGGAVCATLRFDSTGAVLYWCSKTNAFYQVDFTPTLTEPTWFTLLDGYPSHGTNTFWKDVGYWQLVNNPKEDPIRFYRIIEKTNSATPPTVTLTVPPGTLSGTVSISVSVASGPAVLGATLYFDGERVDEIDGSGTFTVDTTQFTNGQHVIFATAENQSGFESTDEGTNNTVNTAGYGLSAFATRTISNAGFGPAAGRPPIPLTNTFGVAFQGDHPSWKDLGPNVNWDGPWNGINAVVGLHGDIGDPDGYTIPRPYGPIRSTFKIADGFVIGLGRVGNRPRFFLGDQDLAKSNYIRSPMFGGLSKFNEVNFGFLIGHGVNGLTFDYTTGLPGVKDTYYPVWKRGNNFYDWVRLSECDFGSANLRWMAILTCNNLVEPNLTDLYNKKFINGLIINENLHLLLGSGGTSYMVSRFGRVFADACARGTNGTPMPIREAWFYAGRQTQHINNPHPGVPVEFTVVGSPPCWHDTIYSLSDPDPFELPLCETRQVYP